MVEISRVISPAFMLSAVLLSGCSWRVVKAMPMTISKMANAPIIFCVICGHSPKTKTPIREVPTSCKPVEMGIVPETPIC